jgi:hypothetical protein
MATLIFQVHLLQWHKGQRSAADESARAAASSRFAIAQQPQYLVLNTPCLIDQHGDDIATNIYPNGRINTALLKDGSIRLDRFIIAKEGDRKTIRYASRGQLPTVIGTLNNGWVEARYQHRYAVEKDDEIFWLYEQLTLNAACVDDYDSDYFLSHQPAVQFLAPS